MKHMVWTETGSVYILDDEAMTWARVKRGPESGYIRTDGGDLVAFPEIKIGEGLALLGPPIVSQADGRIVFTSPVRMAIQNYQDHMYVDFDGAQRDTQR